MVFIKEFSRSYLKTLAHCARKTEMTLWPHLFAAVGSPTSLFDECLSRGDPDTAASYLLILQNLEQPAQSFQFATRLLNVVLDGKRWDLARDLVRFMKVSTISSTNRVANIIRKNFINVKIDILIRLDLKYFFTCKLSHFSC